jgi:hypothetical protein
MSSEKHFSLSSKTDDIRASLAIRTAAALIVILPSGAMERIGVSTGAPVLLNIS